MAMIMGLLPNTGQDNQQWIFPFWFWTRQSPINVLSFKQEENVYIHKTYRLLLYWESAKGVRPDHGQISEKNTHTHTRPAESLHMQDCKWCLVSRKLPKTDQVTFYLKNKMHEILIIFSKILILFKLLSTIVLFVINFDLKTLL